MESSDLNAVKEIKQLLKFSSEAGELEEAVLRIIDRAREGGKVLSPPEPWMSELLRSASVPLGCEERDVERRHEKSTARVFFLHLLRNPPGSLVRTIRMSCNILITKTL